MTRRAASRPPNSARQSRSLRKGLRQLFGWPSGWPRPEEVGQLRWAHPELQKLEDRSFPGQTPGVWGWALGGLGLAFVDQILLASPLDAPDALAVGNGPGTGSSTSSSAANPLLLGFGPTSSPDSSAWTAAWTITATGPASNPAPSDQGLSDSAPTGSPTGNDPFRDPLPSPFDDAGAASTSSGGAARSYPVGADMVGANALAGGTDGGTGAVSGPNVPAELGMTPPLGSPGYPGARATPLSLIPTASVPGAAGTTGLEDTGDPSGGGSNDPEPLIQTQAPAYPHLPLRFEVNQGQTDGQVQFVTNNSANRVFLTPTEMVVEVAQPLSSPPTKFAPAPPISVEVVRMALVGANPHGQLTGQGSVSGVSHYFKGNDSRQWHTNVPASAQVSYANLYPGIDMLYYGNAQSQLEYDFTVHPGASPSTIQLSFTGAQSVYVDAKGNLVLHTPYGDVVEHAPIIYQTVNGVHKPVSGGYVVPDAAHVGVQVGTYDHSKPLVIDPVLSYSTYLGGSQNDVGTGIAVDSAGNMYVTGQTNSPDFPTTSGMYGGSYDAFVSKFDPTGQTLLYSTYLGGSGDDYGKGIALFTDPMTQAVSAYVTGKTNSPSMGSGAFPLVNALPPTDYTTSPGFTSFVTEFDSTGGRLVYSTLLGGTIRTDTFEGTNAIAVDGSGNAYVTGAAQENSAHFPITGGAFQINQSAPDGSHNAFLTELNPTASGSAAVVYSTFLGGTTDDYGYGIALGPNGNVYLTGSTSSADFPHKSNAYQPMLAGGTNAFVTELNPGGHGPSDLVASTFLGGSGSDTGRAIAVDSAGSAYVTGYSFSTNFPTLNPFQAAKKGTGSSPFVTKLNSALSALVYSTYLGGTVPRGSVPIGTFDEGYGIALDSSNDAYVAGVTTAVDFPLLDPVQPDLGGPSVGGNDAFLTDLNAAGNALIYSTHFGTAASGNAVTVDTAGNAYLVGGANYVPTVNPYQSVVSNRNFSDAFVAKFTIRQVYSNAEPALGSLGDPQDTGGDSTGVYLNDGEFHDRETDLTIPGRGLDWEFTRAYRTGVDFVSPLGHDWDFNYNRRLWIVTDQNKAEVRATLAFAGANTGDVVRIDGQNRADLYVNIGNGHFTSPAGFFTQLVQNGNSFVERDAHGLVIKYQRVLDPEPVPVTDYAPMTSLADPAGDMVTIGYDRVQETDTATGPNLVSRITDNHAVWDNLAGQWVRITSGVDNGLARKIGNVLFGTELIFNQDQLWPTAPENNATFEILDPQPTGLQPQTVTDTLGREIDFSYDSFGRLSGVTDKTGTDPMHPGRTLTFTYTGGWDLQSVTSPAVTNTPNGNDFLHGKTEEYTYYSQLTDSRLSHEISSIIAPNQVAQGGQSPTPRVQLTYQQNLSLPNVGWVTAQTLGNPTSGTGVPSGGTITYTYPAAGQTTVNNRDGHVRDYMFDTKGDILHTLVHTDSPYIARNSQPANFQTDYGYNADYELTQVNFPEGNSITYTYDSGNSDRFQQGNLRSVTENPGLRGGNQTSITVSYTYEPINNQILTITDPRGTDMSYMPPFGGGQSAERYQTVFTYDFQEGSNYQGLAAQRQLGETPAQIAALLTNVPMGLPDADGDNDPTDKIAGNVVRVVQPTVHLVPGSNQAFISGGGANPTQAIASFYDYNYYGQLTQSVDPEKNVDQYAYYSVQTPYGPPIDVINGGGYLAQTLTDTVPQMSDPTRDNGVINLPYANIREQYGYDPVGNVTSVLDGRGIQTNYSVNQLNQVVQVTQAAVVPTQTSTAEPMQLYAFQYLERYFYDANNNLFLTQAEDRGNTSGLDSGLPPTNLPGFLTLDSGLVDMPGGTTSFGDSHKHWAPSQFVGYVVQITSGTDMGQFRTITANTTNTLTVSPGFSQAPDGTSAYAILGYKNTGGTYFANTVTKYDLLDEPIETLQEISGAPNTKYLATEQRYDADGNPVMTIYPAGNADAAIYDERDLLYKSIQGTSGRPQYDNMTVDGNFAMSDPTAFNRPGGMGTASSTFTDNYDKSGNLIESVDAVHIGAGTTSTIAGVGDLTQTQFDGFDRPTVVTDPLGNQTLTQYDPASNVVRVIQTGDPVNNQSPTTNPHNTLAVTEYIPDELSRTVATHQVLFATPGTSPRRPPVLSSNPAMAALAPYLADTSGPTGSVPGRTDITVLGRMSTLSEYDRDSRPTFTVADDLAVRRTDYDGAGRVIQTTDSALNNGFNPSPGQFNPANLAGNTFQTAYDGEGNVIETKQTDVTSVPGVASESFITTSFYDALNRPQTQVDNLGQAQDFRYDSRGNLVAESDAKGPATGSRTISRRGLGPPGQVTINTYGNVTLSSYDGLNRQVETDTLLTASGQGDGMFIGADANGQKQPIPQGYLDPTQAGDGLISTYNAWDDNSQLLAQRDDNGNTVAYIYDNQNRTLVERKGLNVPGATIAVNGGETGAFDASLRGGVGTFNTMAAGTDLLYGYDPNSNVTRLTDEAGNVFTNTFDALNRQTRTRVTPVNGFVGPTTQTWQFDGLSRSTQSSDDNGGGTAPLVTEADYYDSLSRPIEEDQTIGTYPVQTVSWNYNLATAGGTVDGASALVYPDTRQVDYGYDSAERLVSARDHGQTPYIGSVQYLGPDRVAVRTYQNNTRLTYISQSTDTGYDLLGRPVKPIWEGWTSPTPPPLGGGSVLEGFGYVYDRDGNVISQEKLHDPIDSEVYSYRSDSELTSFGRGTLSADKKSIQTPTTRTGTLQSQSWTPPGVANLDGVGNWDANTYTVAGSSLATEQRTHTNYNAINVVSGTPYGGGPATTYQEDANGNVTSDGVFTYKYDAFNRLVQVWQGSPGQLMASYYYAADGRRVETAVGSITTLFAYAGRQVVEEDDGALPPPTNTVVRQYVYGEGGALWTLDQRRDGQGNAISVAQLNDGQTMGGSGDQRLYYLEDPQGSVYGLTNKGGLLREAYEYDAYGRQTIFAAVANVGINFNDSSTFVLSVAGSSPHNNPYLYAGYRLDGLTNLYYVDARYYSATEGRFLQRDPSGYAAGDPNLYRYTGNNPTDATDPSGLAADPTTDPSKFVKARVAKLKAQLQQNGAEGYVIMGVGVVEDKNGNRSVLIGTSERKGYIRRGVDIKPGEIVVPGSGHAEADIVAYTKRKGLKLIDIGATRPVCSDCELKINSTEAHVSTPLKGAPSRGASKAAAKAMAGINVYLTLREALQAAGVFQPDFVQVDAPYYFTAKDGSVFVIEMPGWFGSYKRRYIAGPRAGLTLELTESQFEIYKREAEATWGKYIPGSLFREPRFIPGTHRKRLPLTDEWLNEIGYIDENGIHRYSPLMIHRGA